MENFAWQGAGPEARYNRNSAHFTCASKIEASDCSAAKLSNTKQKVEIKKQIEAEISRDVCFQSVNLDISL